MRVAIISGRGKPTRYATLPEGAGLDEATAAALGIEPGDTIEVKATLDRGERLQPERITKSYGGVFDPTKFDPALLRLAHR